MKMDVIPGRENHYRITPTTIGDYRGKCYELCGVYHSRMLFNVKVVSPEDYESYLQDLEAAGNVSDEPLLGGTNAEHPAGPARRRRGGHGVTTTAGRPTIGVTTAQAARPTVRPGHHHHRPQGHRQPLPGHVVRLVPGRPA